ncbi:hypothetical protein DUNSADRAFT_5606 [Dunaliella salina]|uniref:Uncharacterized protein n=1 Tax=Dunaliella salina TaxID=3046 RepID=A0ABQ7GQ09_DUNSA|nr:hypothetical protein DUNSADRAFT_5606 [Dunaliella salina]|eukprot:KAF5836680.1 hypothetical protein DUNSADRAFT_5606 [Dunaliella salina]
MGENCGAEAGPRCHDSGSPCVLQLCWRLWPIGCRKNQTLLFGLVSAPDRIQNFSVLQVLCRLIYKLTHAFYQVKV